MRHDERIKILECEGVYPPAEDTFLLLQCVPDVRGKKVLEMGCGTGIIALNCAAAGAEVTAVDINPKAVQCTKSNAELNGLELEVVISDLFLDVEGRFDLIIFNPPYVPDMIRGEIERSWAGGEDGVRVLDRFLRAAPRHLNEGGEMLILFSSCMNESALQCALSQFVRDRIASRHLFFEEIWVERLILPRHATHGFKK
ncbi:MAG: methyltransferase [Methanomassiliicoccales archaeon]